MDRVAGWGICLELLERADEDPENFYTLRVLD